MKFLYLGCSTLKTVPTPLQPAFLPETVEDVAVGIDPQHHVIGGGVMDEGALGVHKEHVGHPDLLHQAAVEGHALVVGALEGQTLVLPVVAQVESHGEILEEHRERYSAIEASAERRACR